MSTKPRVLSDYNHENNSCWRAGDTRYRCSALVCIAAAALDFGEAVILRFVIEGKGSQMGYPAQLPTSVGNRCYGGEVEWFVWGPQRSSMVDGYKVRSSRNMPTHCRIQRAVMGGRRTPLVVGGLQILLPQPDCARKTGSKLRKG